jgi:hypothetical protein
MQLTIVTASTLSLLVHKLLRQVLTCAHIYIGQTLASHISIKPTRKHPCEFIGVIETRLVLELRNHTTLAIIRSR